jgi:hypothetical protein
MVVPQTTGFVLALRLAGMTERDDARLFENPPPSEGGEGLRSLHRSDSGRATTAVAQRRVGLFPRSTTEVPLFQGRTRNAA